MELLLTVNWAASEERGGNGFWNTYGISKMHTRIKVEGEKNEEWEGGGNASGNVSERGWWR